MVIAMNSNVHQCTILYSHPLSCSVVDGWTGSHTQTVSEDPPGKSQILGCGFCTHMSVNRTEKWVKPSVALVNHNTKPNYRLVWSFDF